MPSMSQMLFPEETIDTCYKIHMDKNIESQKGQTRKSMSLLS